MASPSLEELILALGCLPGVGRKSAQRMALHLLERDQAGARRIADALNAALMIIFQSPIIQHYFVPV